MGRARGQRAHLNRAEVIRMADENPTWSQSDLGRHFGVSPQTISYHLARRDHLDGSQRGWPSARREVVVARFTDGTYPTLQQVGEEFGITRERVRQHLVKAGLGHLVKGQFHQRVEQRRAERKPPMVTCYLCGHQYEFGDSWGHRRTEEHQMADHQAALGTAPKWLPKAIEMWREGKLMREISAALGVHMVALNRGLVSQGLRRYARYSGIIKRNEAIWEEYMNGATPTDLAMQFDLSYGRIVGILREVRRAHANGAVPPTS